MPERNSELYKSLQDEDASLSSLMFTTFVQNSTEAMYFHDMQGNILEINNTTILDTGYTRDELLTMTTLDIDPSLKNIDGLFESWQKYIPFEYHNFETTHVNKWGKHYPVEMRSGKVILKGNPYILTFVKNVSNQKKAEKEVQEAYDMLSLIMDNIPQFVFWKDSNSIYLGGNQKFIEAAGFKTNHELIGKNDFECAWTKQEATKYIHDDLEVIKSKKPKFHIIEAQHQSNGSIAWLETNKLPLFDENQNVVGILGTFENITERIKAKKDLEDKNREYIALNEELKQTNEDLFTAKEHAEESDKLKSAFLANLSHEIRTPMNSILGFADLLREQDLTKDLKNNYIEIIEQRGNHLLSIISDIIEISKIETGQIKPIYSTVYLPSFFETLYQSMLIVIPKEKKEKIQLLMDEDVPEITIETDETKMLQVMTNLLSNAIRYSDKGHIYFGCFTKESHLHFYVKDSGIGIPEQYLESIFNRFTQVENTATKSRGGSGLGLAITKAYIDLLGGTIEVKSTVGKGSLFKCSLPLTVKDIAKQKKELQNISDYTITKPATILVADDEDLNFLYFKQVLKNLPYALIHAKNGSEAVDICKKRKDIDLILMDIKMPVMDGFEAIKNLRKLKIKMPIIAQTAHALYNDKKEIERAGFNGYLTKPINKEKLFKMIYDLLL